MTISMDGEGVSNIYQILNGRNESILEEAAKKWNEKIPLHIDTFLISK